MLMLNLSGRSYADTAFPWSEGVPVHQHRSGIQLKGSGPSVVFGFVDVQIVQDHVKFAVARLNQIEIWFSKLSRDALKGASFTSAAQLRKAIDHYIKAHNANA